MVLSVAMVAATTEAMGAAMTVTMGAATMVAMAVAMVGWLLEKQLEAVTMVVVKTLLVVKIDFG